MEYKTRAMEEVKIREKSERARETEEAKAKRDANATERARAWAWVEAQAKENAKIARIAAEAGGAPMLRPQRGRGRETRRRRMSPGFLLRIARRSMLRMKRGQGQL